MFSSAIEIIEPLGHSAVEVGSHCPAVASFGAGDQVDNDLVADGLALLVVELAAMLFGFLCTHLIELSSSVLHFSFERALASLRMCVERMGCSVR